MNWKPKYIVTLMVVVAAFWPLRIAKSALIQDVGPDNGDEKYLSLYNSHSGEAETIVYADQNGKYLPEGLEEVKKMLRCRLTGEEHPIAPELIELVHDIYQHFGKKEIKVISGYRSPELNASLRRKGRRVAKESYHMYGMAVDIVIPGVPLRSLRDYARNLHAGGVGYYPRKFVHVDVGPVRYW